MAHVLIVDDDDQVAKLIKEILADAGHTSDRAAAAYSAVLKMMSSRYDIVLMDVLIQGANGIVAALALRGMGYRGPIIAVTGNLMQIDQDLYDLVGFSGKLLKPFASEEVVDEVNRQLNK